MVNNRNALTYAANITVLSISLVLFVVITNGATAFTVLCLICLSLGACTTLFYSFKIREGVLTKKSLELEQIYRRK
jgi:hypothetical protein